MKPGILLAFAFLVFVSLGHLLRLVFRIPLAIGSVVVPMWPSVVAVPLFAGLAFLVWRETHPPSGRS